MSNSKGVAIVSEKVSNLSDAEKDTRLEERSDLVERVYLGDASAVTEMFNLLGHKAVNISTQVIKE